MRILALAYACEPDRGSEPGAGWVLARMLARLGETWVVTRSNNRPSIEAVLQHVPEREGMRFSYVDLPAWCRVFKRGRRGVRLYYLAWQLLALRRARRLHQVTGFDVVWHVTLANVWLGSVGQFVGPAFIYGPVGGGARVPLPLLPSLGLRGACYELLRDVGRWCGRYGNPLARSAWRGARLILVQNSETAQWLPARHRGKAAVFPNAVMEEDVPAAHEARPGTPTALFAGRLTSWKGAALALAAVARVPHWRLLVCGTGPDEARIRRQAHALAVEERVTFLRQLPRSELLCLMRERTHALLYPSLREDAGWVVAEAVASGLPVICLDRGGPAVLAGAAGLAIPVVGDVDRLVAGLARHLATGCVDPEVVRRRGRDLGIDARTKVLAGLLARAGLSSRPGPSRAPVTEVRR